MNIDTYILMLIKTPFIIIYLFLVLDKKKTFLKTAKTIKMVFVV